MRPGLLPAPRRSLIHCESPRPLYRPDWRDDSGRSAQLVGVAQPIACGLDERFVWGQAGMGRVRSDAVVVAPPGLDENPGLGERGEDFFIQALIAEATVEAFDEGVLCRFAGRNIMPFEARLVRPFP